MTTTWPKYCTDGLAYALRGVTGAHTRTDLASIEAAAAHAADKELTAVRALLDGSSSSDEFWPRVGFRAITEAWRHEAHLARIKAALESDRFSHITSRHPVAPDLCNVYHRSDGPTGCKLVVSFRADDEAARALVGARSVVPGGRRGAAA